MKEATEVKGTVSGLNGKGGAVKANKPKRRGVKGPMKSNQFHSLSCNERSDWFNGNVTNGPTKSIHFNSIRRLKWNWMIEWQCNGPLSFHEVHSAFINYMKWINLAKLNGMRMNIITVIEEWTNWARRNLKKWSVNEMDWSKWKWSGERMRAHELRNERKGTRTKRCSEVK